jgi:hypothetical protein
MSVGRRCRSCGARAVHRAPRQRWQRWLAWVAPLRPQHCIECGAESWGPLHADEGLARYAVAAAFWLLVLSVLWPGGDAAVPVAAEHRPAPSPVGSPEPEPVESMATAAVEVMPLDVAGDRATAAVESPNTVAAPVDDPTPAEARQRAMRLDGIDVRWTGEAMEVVIRGGDGVLFHTLRFDANVQGYVLDLPGRWTLPNSLRMVRSFERSNLLRLRLGRHRDFLRIVFSLRDPAGSEPQVERRDAQLRLLFR